ncbi:MAG: dihydropteroate synthase [Alphaproteobacteria bacterium]|nr:dihydropteroate synthase [Alphaproteobacteria bacterium]
MVVSCPVDRSTVLPKWNEKTSGCPRPLWLEKPNGNVYIVPTGITGGATAETLLEAGLGRPFGDGALAFTGCEVLIRDSGTIWSVLVSVSEVLEWAKEHGRILNTYVVSLINRIGVKRKSFAGVSIKSPCIMGIVNVTPDSFSDGGKFEKAEKAIHHGITLLEAGAKILDVGGESTRPNSVPVSVEEELNRVVPVVKDLANRGAVVSIDTRHSKVMATCLEAGAKIINDISAFTDDKESLQLVAKNRIPAVIMHKQGKPADMQDNPEYSHAPLDVYDYLSERVDACETAGMRRIDVCIDAGIGFGKTVQHNIEILSYLSLFQGLGCPVLLGVSRKSFIGKLSKNEPPLERFAGSLTAGQFGLDQGVQILRVHDVAETAQAISVWKAVRALS